VNRAGLAWTAVTALGEGSGSNVTPIVKAGPEQVPLPAPPEPPPTDLVELCSVTSLTPSISRRRVSTSATWA
jgi:hypothetical protein